MKLTKDKLITSLLDHKELQGIYVILGSESIQIDECLEKIYIKSKSENFTEKETYIIEKKTEWDFLRSNTDNFDLFGNKKIIEIKLIGQGPGVTGAKELKEYASKPDPNILLVVTGESLEKKSYSSAWVEALEKAGILISVPPISQATFPIWIKDKGQSNNINISSEARLLLAEKTEGNLIATLQEIKKLALIYPNQKIDLKKMKESITDSSKYNIYDFSNAFVEGNTKKAIRILESLKTEGTPEALILWALSKEINNLFKVSKSGSTKGLWGPKSYLNTLEKTAKRIPTIRIKKALQEIAQIDSSIKGFINQNPWLGIRQLTLTF